jgi:hypothetical protein
MSFADSIANDYKVSDGVESVTFTVVRSGTTTAYTVTHADGHDLNANEIAALGGAFGTRHKNWTLGRNQITQAAHYPQPGDTVTDVDSGVWKVLDAVLDDLQRDFSCNCVKGR